MKTTEDEKESGRLDELGARIDSARGKLLENQEEEGETGAGMGATRVSIELMAGVAVGSFGGYYLDKWLETSPVFFIAGFFFGVAAGALNIYKLAAGARSRTDADK